MQLKTVLDKVLALPGAEKPLVALFFRRQMVTIISRALRELDIVPLSSQRCFALLGTAPPVPSWMTWHAKTERAVRQRRGAARVR